MAVEKHGFQFDSRLLEYIEFGRVNGAKSMLNEDLAKASDGSRNTLLHYAVSWRSGKIVRHLLELGADVDSPGQGGNTPLILAVLRFDKPVVDALLEANADIGIVNCDGVSALKIIFHSDYVNMGIVESLLRRLQSQSNDTEQLVDQLMLMGGNVYRAVFLKDTRLIECMLQRGFDANGKDYRKITALHLAAKRNEAQLAKLLIDYGADVNALDGNGESPLLHAALNGSKDAMKVLLEAGADPNAKRFIGYSAVFAVLFYVHDVPTEATEECLELLFQYGAIPQNSPYRGFTLFDLALNNGKSKIYNMLMNYLVMLRELDGPIDNSIFHCKRKASSSTISESIDVCRKFLSNVVYGNLTMLKLLTDYENKMRIHVRNNNLMSELHKLLSDDGNKQVFPYYLITVTKRISKARHAVELEDTAISVISQIMTGNQNQCYVIAREVVRYLDEEDLERLDQIF